jgi:hypothetical protein
VELLHTIFCADVLWEPSGLFRGSRVLYDYSEACSIVKYTPGLVPEFEETRHNGEGFGQRAPFIIKIDQENPIK